MNKYQNTETKFTAFQVFCLFVFFGGGAFFGGGEQKNNTFLELKSVDFPLIICEFSLIRIPLEEYFIFYWF